MRDFRGAAKHVILDLGMIPEMMEQLMLAALRAAADTGYTSHHEYAMARVLRAEEAGR